MEQSIFKETIKYGSITKPEIRGSPNRIPQIPIKPRSKDTKRYNQGIPQESRQKGDTIMMTCWDCKHHQYCPKGILFQGEIITKDVKEECDKFQGDKE